jgi:hypothetical protein
MNELTEEEIVKRIISDKGALKELVYHIVSDPEVRMAVISAVLTEVTTKQDVRDLRQEMNQLRTEINDMRRGDEEPYQVDHHSNTHRLGIYGASGDDEVSWNNLIERTKVRPPGFEPGTLGVAGPRPTRLDYGRGPANRFFRTF